jgi:hypothetical protein
VYLKKITKKLGSSLLLSSLTFQASAVDILIYDYSAAGNEAAGLASRQTAAGNTVTDIDITSTFNTHAPGDISNFEQVWDLGANKPLNATQEADYLTYLQGGGTLFLMGENVGFGATRNAELVTFIGTTLGAGSLTIGSPGADPETVDSDYQLAVSNNTVNFPLSGASTSIGTGECITSECSAVAWGVGTLANASLGTVITVLDVNFLQTSFLANNSQATSIDGSGTQDFTDNLIAYLTQQAAVAAAAASGPSASDTQSSLHAAADDLRRIVNLQSMYLINSLSYECNIYDEKNLCFKVQTQNDSVIGNVNNMSTATAISSYRFNNNLSVGGFISDSYSDNNSKYIDVYDKAPLVGLFSQYRFNNKLQGLNIKTSMAYSDREIDQSRKVFGTSESGKGESGLSSFGIQAILSYDMPVRPNIVWSPSVGARYTKITRNGYTETSTSAVTTPLTFDDINQERTTLIIGNALRYQLNDKTSMRAYVNYEQELNYNGAKFATTGVSGTTNFNLSNDIHHAKLVGGLGLSYQPKQNHEVSVAYNYRKSAMNANEISSVFASYAIGF